YQTFPPLQQTLLFLFLGLILCLESGSSQAARRLRKKPKVYNALITTDDNLTSSRAYPVIQPTIHEPGYAPFGPYNPYGFYSPPVVRFGQPIVPGLEPNERLPYPLPAGFATSYEDAHSVQPQPQGIPAPNPTEPKEMPKEQLPQLPLNEQGLPPVLIPLSSQYNGQPTHLPAYPFSQYPVIYDQAGYIRQNYLPPYDYYPSQGYPTRVNAAQQPQQQEQPQHQPQPQVQDQSQSDEEVEDIQPLALENLNATPSFEDIKNGSENKNINVPDVPPPPIPSGPKQRPRPKNN
ncbi:uncharacterized protein Dwil_GK11914, partial [Drosophila willistoni]